MQVRSRRLRRRQRGSRAAAQRASSWRAGPQSSTLLKPGGMTRSSSRSSITPARRCAPQACPPGRRAATAGGSEKRNLLPDLPAVKFGSRRESEFVASSVQPACVLPKLVGPSVDVLFNAAHHEDCSRTAGLRFDPLVDSLSRSPHSATGSHYVSWCSERWRLERAVSSRWGGRSRKPDRETTQSFDSPLVKIRSIPTLCR